MLAVEALYLSSSAAFLQFNTCLLSAELSAPCAMIPGTLTVALAAFLFLASALADVGPYFDSERYEQGGMGPWPIETYRSTSTVGAVVNFLQYGPQCKDDQYYFISPRGYSVHKPGPMILDQKGRLVWTKPYGHTYNFNVYNYKGQDYLTFWVGDDSRVGHGEGTYYMVRHHLYSA